ncbi:MAG: NAD(P)/FAD-dependent oxidoreductase [Candidatus Anstonellales archaeon]
MQEIYDVAIVGGGPAGTYCAKCAAEMGLSVILLEENETIGEPVHCGECLSKLCTLNYGIDLPLEAISKKVKGIRVVFPSGKDTYLDEEGYVLEKAKFEQYIAETAERKGATMVLGAKVEGIKKGEDLWSLSTKKGNYTSRILVDASGSYSVVSNFLKLNESRFETVVGLQYEMEDVTTSGYIDFYLDIEAFPHGYFWIIPKSGERANVGLVTNEKTKAKAYLDSYIEKIGLDKKRKRKTFGGLIPSSGPLPKTYGERVMLIGDAAGFTSPLFEGGTHLAIASAKYAAEVAAEAIKNGERSAEFFSKYEKIWRSRFPEYSALLKGKNALYRLTNNELNQVGDLFPQKVANINLAEKLAIGIKLTWKYPHLYNKGIISILRSFGYSRAEFFGW